MFHYNNPQLFSRSTFVLIVFTCFFAFVACKNDELTEEEKNELVLQELERRMGRSLDEEPKVKEIPSKIEFVEGMEVHQKGSKIDLTEYYFMKDKEGNFTFGIDNKPFVSFKYAQDKLNGKARFSIQRDTDATPQTVFVGEFNEDDLDKKGMNVLAFSEYLNRHPKLMSNMKRAMVLGYKHFKKNLIEIEQAFISGNYNVYENNKKQGVWVEWIINECLETQNRIQSAKFYNNIIHDSYGSLCIGRYRDGEKEGKWMTFHPDHSIDIISYRRLKNGKGASFNIDGSFEFGSYRDNLKSSDWRIITPDGSVTKKRMYAGKDGTEEYVAAQNEARAEARQKENTESYSCDGERCTWCKQGYYSNGICSSCSSACAERNADAQTKLNKLKHGEQNSLTVSKSSHSDQPYEYNNGETYSTDSYRFERIDNFYLQPYLMRLGYSDMELLATNDEMEDPSTDQLVQQMMELPILLINQNISRTFSTGKKNVVILTSDLADICEIQHVSGDDCEISSSNGVYSIKYDKEGELVVQIQLGAKSSSNSVIRTTTIPFKDYDK